jgi:hypothetical protein
MPGDSFEADISGLIPIPTTNIEPIASLKSDGKHGPHRSQYVCNIPGAVRVVTPQWNTNGGLV